MVPLGSTGRVRGAGWKVNSATAGHTQIILWQEEELPTGREPTVDSLVG